MSLPIRSRKPETRHQKEGHFSFALLSAFWFLISGFWLTGCGFEPLYGRGNAHAPAAAEDLARVEIAGVEVVPVSGRIGQQFRADLEDRLNPTSRALPALYRLKVLISPVIQSLGITPDGMVSRLNLHLSSNFTLTRISDGKEMLRGSVRRVSGYNNVANAYFSVFVSENDAYRRGVTELAEDYRLRLAAFFAQGEPAP